MSQAKQDLKDFASFFTNAVKEIEEVEKRANRAEWDLATARRVYDVQREKYHKLRLTLHLYETLNAHWGAPVLPRLAGF